MILDPVVHRVAGHKLYIGHLLAHAPLQDRIDVSQKQKLGVAIGLGNLRLKGCKDVQLGVVRLGLVQVVEIGAFPEEALARRVLNAARVDAASLKDRLLPPAKILAHDGDDAHIGKEARS